LLYSGRNLLLKKHAYRTYVYIYTSKIIENFHASRVVDDERL
jgi:hypothetical protein